MLKEFFYQVWFRSPVPLFLFGVAGGALICLLKRIAIILNRKNFSLKETMED